MAIDELLDEHEQGERVRSWLRKNGVALLGGVATGLALILGGQWWSKHHTDALAESHAQYETVVKSIEAKDLDKAGKDMAVLASNQSGIYGELAALRLAKAQVDAGKNDDAIAVLRSVQSDDQFKLIVDQRLARLLIETGKPADAQTLLASATDGASLEIRADAAVAQNKRDEARDLYTKALALVDVASPQRRLLETKLTDVGGTVPDPSQPI
jgi:predicted negative regulator of RcsB-dependent stress response